MMIKKVILLLVATATFRCAATDYTIERAETESQAYEYVAQRLGLCGYKEALSQRICHVLEDYNLPISLLGGLFVGVPVGGYVAQGLSVESRQSKIACDVIGGLLVIILIHAGIKGLGKKYADMSSFFRDRLTEFVKEWPQHQENTPIDYHGFFERLYTDYKDHGKIVHNDVMIDAFYGIFAEKFINAYKADIEYVV